MKVVLLLFFSVFLASGCAIGPKPNQFWFGAYSKSLYDLKKRPSPEQLTQHQNQLISIIEKTESAKGVVPPSLYAELGFTYYQQNSFSEAVRYFELEKTHYPESLVLMNHMIERTKKPQSSSPTMQPQSSK
jgi:hypothetical protein